jgi:hypothetical protein
MCVRSFEDASDKGTNSFEDLSKFVWLRLYWDPQQPLSDVLQEYAAHYFRPEVAGDVEKLLHLLERANARQRWRIPHLDQVSDDGQTLTPAGTSTKIPKEDDVVAQGTPAWAYAIGKTGRYLRVNLGASQRKQPPYAGTLELTEVQVLGKPPK